MFSDYDWLVNTVYLTSTLLVRFKFRPLLTKPKLTIMYKSTKN